MNDQTDGHSRWRDSVSSYATHVQAVACRDAPSRDLNDYDNFLQAIEMQTNTNEIFVFL
jgi:hypothetical protein